MGCIHVVIVNPEDTPIQRIPIDYDMSDMPRGTKTFIRYKQFLKDGGTRVAFHFKIYSSKRSGRLYLYHEIRLFFSMVRFKFLCGSRLMYVCVHTYQEARLNIRTKHHFVSLTSSLFVFFFFLLMSRLASRGTLENWKRLLHVP